MRAADRPESTVPETLGELPWFALDYFVDDRDDPSRVMVMPREIEPGSSDQWISIDSSHAVALDEVR